MKKNFYLLATLFISTLTVFSACSDDDDKGDEPTNEDVKTVTLDATAYNKWVYLNFSDGKSVTHEIEPVAGTYDGDLSVNVRGREVNYEDLKMEVNRVEGDSLTLTIKDFAMGEITAGATIAAEETGWSLVGGDVVTTDMTVSCQGTINGDDIELNMTIFVAAMNTTMTGTYKGVIETRSGIDETSFDWDIALHRYDVKTNGASAIATTEGEMAKVSVVPASGYVADIKTDSIMIDTKGMTSNKVGYASGNWNEVLNKGVEFDSKTMPPPPTAWSMSGLVYIIKLTSGEYAKIKFTDYSSDADVKGHITFDYVYPFK